MIVARIVLGQDKHAAQCASSRLRPTGVPTLVLSGPSHVVQVALTALRSLPSRAGPVALRDMDALCIKGWSKMRSLEQSAPTPIERQPKLMINVKVGGTEDL